MAPGEGPRGERGTWHRTGNERNSAQKRDKCREKSNEEGKPGSSRAWALLGTLTLTSNRHSHRGFEQKRLSVITHLKISQTPL